MTSPGRIALVANSTDWETVTPDGVDVLLDLGSLAVKVPPRDRLFGVFTENVNELPAVLAAADKYRVRPSFIQDGPGYFPIGVLSKLPQWGLPIKELYRYQGESLDAAIKRWTSEGADLAMLWPWDLGAILPCYTMNGLYSSIEVQTIVAAGITHLNASNPRWKLSLCFAWKRADGGDLPELATLQTTVCVQTPGFPDFEPIPPPPPPPVTLSTGALLMDIAGVINHYGIHRDLGKDDQGNQMCTLYSRADKSKIVSGQRDGSLGERDPESTSGNGHGSFERIKVFTGGQFATINAAQQDGSDNYHSYAVSYVGGGF